MSIDLELGVAAISADTVQAATVAAVIEAEVGGVFGDNSGDDIQLTTFLADIKAPERFYGPIDNDALGRALEAVTGYQQYKGKVQKIGILIADRFEYRPDFFGYMFDEDFLPGGSNPWASTPREGCAIFLGGIADARNPGTDFLEEALYTATHELGHVFNLQHSQPPSFMAQSADQKTPFPIDTTSFNSAEQFLLSNCSTSRHIWPGGSRFGDLGPFGKSTPSESPANAVATARLRITVTRTECWSFEPVELNIEINANRGMGKKTLQIPDMLDPGYEEFKIWIQEPSGEVRRYRSPNHYCKHNKTLSLKPGQSFKRDVSIFGESGSLTFRKVGTHRIWVTFKTGRHAELRSNLVELQILGWSLNDPHFLASRFLLMDNDIGQLIYHRKLTYRRSRKISNLVHMCEAKPRSQTSTAINYAIGRAYAAATIKSRKAGNTSETLARKARLHLKKAMREARVLGDHRAQHAEKDLAEI